MTLRWLIDTSAWSRLEDRLLSDQRRRVIADAFEAGDIAVCLPLLLEVGYATRNAAQHRRRINDLLSLPRMVIDVAIEDRAIEAQQQLAGAGHHRMPPADIIVAALADRYRLGVLHYDNDFDVLVSKTTLHFESEWLAPRGSLRS